MEKRFTEHHSHTRRTAATAPEGDANSLLLELEKAQLDATASMASPKPYLTTGIDARRKAELMAEDTANALTKVNSDQTRDGDRPVEIGGPKGLEPTRYGDWEKAGRCIDF